MGQAGILANNLEPSLHSAWGFLAVDHLFLLLPPSLCGMLLAEAQNEWNSPRTLSDTVVLAQKAAPLPHTHTQGWEESPKLSPGRAGIQLIR